VFTTFLVKRFDRTAEGRRHAFVSAMPSRSIRMETRVAISSLSNSSSQEVQTPQPTVSSCSVAFSSTFAFTTRMTTSAITVSLLT